LLSELLYCKSSISLLPITNSKLLHTVNDCHSEYKKDYNGYLNGNYTL